MPATLVLIRTVTGIVIANKHQALIKLLKKKKCTDTHSKFTAAVGAFYYSHQLPLILHFILVSSLNFFRDGFPSAL